jgi:hypothetical protein
VKLIASLEDCDRIADLRYALSAHRSSRRKPQRQSKQLIGGLKAKNA